MPRVKLTNEFKKAVSQLPGKEKDRLLYRLLAKDAVLVEQLEFKLLENSETTEMRREEVRNSIEESLQRSAERYYSPGYLLLDIRSLSGKINHHVKITRDKYGEVALNLFLLNRTMELLGDKIKRAWPHRSQSFNEYVIKRSLKLLKLLEKIPEDYRADFQSDFEQLASYLFQQPNMQRVARQEGLDIEKLKQV